MGMVFCRGCGKEIHESAPTCPHCGAPQRSSSSATGASNNKSQTSAFLFAFFLGNFGAHRFYLGNIGLGILYLFTLGLLGFGTLVDVISLAFMKADKFANKYNNGQLSDPIGVWAKVIVLIFPALFFIGMLSAIALPAYQDYTVRTRVSEVMILIAAPKAMIAESYQAGMGCPDPSDFSPSNAKYGSAVIDNECNVFIRFDQPASPAQLKGKSIGIYAKKSSVAGELDWVCKSADVPSRYLPTSCR